MQCSAVPEAMAVRASLVLPGVSPVRRGTDQNQRRSRDSGVRARRFNQKSTVIAGAQPMEREIMRSELVNASREIGEILCDQIEIDVIQSTGIRVGAEIYLTSGIALFLAYAGGQEKDLGERGKVRDILARVLVRYFADGHRYGFQGRERRAVENLRIANERNRFHAAVDLEGQRLVFPIKKVHVRTKTLFTVLGAFVIIQGRLGILILTPFVHLDGDTFPAVETHQ